jgi:hypothetical protein
MCSSKRILQSVEPTASSTLLAFVKHISLNSLSRWTSVHSQPHTKLNNPSKSSSYGPVVGKLYSLRFTLSFRIRCQRCRSSTPSFAEGNRGRSNWGKIVSNEKRGRGCGNRSCCGRGASAQGLDFRQTNNSTLLAIWRNKLRVVVEILTCYSANSLDYGFWISWKATV